MAGPPSAHADGTAMTPSVVTAPTNAMTERPPDATRAAMPASGRAAIRRMIRSHCRRVRAHPASRPSASASQLRAINFYAVSKKSKAATPDADTRLDESLRATSRPRATVLPALESARIWPAEHGQAHGRRSKIREKVSNINCDGRTPLRHNTSARARVTQPNDRAATGRSR